MHYNPQKIQQFLETTGKQFCFAVISGARLYGFASDDSDLDVRGCHVPSLEETIRYFTVAETFERMTTGGRYYPNELDIVSHTLIKYVHLMTKQPNGYILEQIFSPLVITTSDIHDQLKLLAQATISKEMRFHYGGFFKNQAQMVEKESHKEIKLVLYQLRILASALYLAKTHTIEANLLQVNADLGLYDHHKLQELLALKHVHEQSGFADLALKTYWLSEIQRVRQQMEEAFETSKLPNFDSNTARTLAENFILSHFSLTYEP